MKPSEKMAIMLLAAANEISFAAPKPSKRPRMLAAYAMRKWCPMLSFARIAAALGYKGPHGARDAYLCLSSAKDRLTINQCAFVDEYVRNECMVLVRAINVATMANAKPFEVRHAA